MQKLSQVKLDAVTRTCGRKVACPRQNLWYGKQSCWPVCNTPDHRQRRRAMRRPLRPCAAFQAVLNQAKQPVPGIPIGVTVCSLVFLLGSKALLSGLTWPGMLHSWFLGSMVYAAFGWPGFLHVCLYFIFGTLATRLRRGLKEAEGTAEKRHGRRSIGSVWGSGLAGVVCAIAALTTQHHGLWQGIRGIDCIFSVKVGFAASFVSKLSDTVSSEIGKGYGKTTYLSTNFQRVPRGTEGAVSLEGTLAGIGAAFAFTAYAALAGLVTLQQGRLVVLAAILANWAESVFGALTQGKAQFQWISNDLVNMAQIILAASLAMIFIDF